MKYRLFGRSGLRVSEICLGTMTFGEEFGWGESKKVSRKVFDAYLEAGGNFIDTANYYTKGTSEKFLGEFIQGEREKLVLATKYTLSTNPQDPNASGSHRKNMHQALDASLKRLKTDYIDLYWVHAWDFLTPIDELLRALDDMVRAGKILHIGLSDTPAWIVSRSNAIAELRGWTSFAGVQLEYSLIERTIEPEFFQMARSLDLAIAAWSPLAMGILTGKYLHKTGKESRFSINPEWGKNYLTERNEQIVKAVVKIAKKLKKTPAQIALKWILQQPVNVIPIVGAKRPEQLIENLDISNFELSPEDLGLLDELSAVENPFPHSFLQREDLLKTRYGETFDQLELF